jgi:acyl-coenzyme A synthetase/AMP-(fatty) acid ligase
MTLIGNRPEWVLTMVACFRIGAVALPCNEQLRAKDLRQRLAAARPRLLVADERNAGELTAALDAESDLTCEVILIPDASLLDHEPAPAVELDARDPCLITFTSGTTGEAKGIVHGQRYLPGQKLQASHWLDARPGDLVWCTAATGWSKSARNVFIAPWLRGAAALLHDARFDPVERLEVLAAERVNVLCMAPTEYRVIAKRAQLAPVASLRGLVAAGEALNPEVLRAFREGTGLEIRDGYGQTETGQLTGVPADGAVRPGSMGRPLPGIRLEVVDDELVLADPSSDPTFFVSYLDGASAPEHKPWHTGDRVQSDEDGYLYFEGRTDDLIISAGYRIGPFEVESALVSHDAVAERARRRRAARRLCALRHADRPAPGPRQAGDRAVQVPADRRLRRRAAQDGQRQGAARHPSGALSLPRVLGSGQCLTPAPSLPSSPRSSRRRSESGTSRPRYCPPATSPQSNAPADWPC